MTQRIAVIGGGFSGTLTIANLVRKSLIPLTVEWFEERGEPGKGVAYSTRDTSHLLNVRTDRIGAFAGKPEGFWEWLHTQEGASHAAKFWPHGNVKPESFAPRALFGAYLASILDEALTAAKNKGIRIHIHSKTVADAMPVAWHRLAIEAGTGEPVVVDALILATGNLPPACFPFEETLGASKKYYVTDIWNPNVDGVFPHRVSALPANSDIVIIGTGLTMIDALLTLHNHGYPGRVAALSRHGWLPAAHRENVRPYPAWEWTQAPERAPISALGLLVGLRREVCKAMSAGYDWRSVIDSLRPVTPLLWRRLDLKEKRRFLKRLFSLWNIHRHRMAPEVARKLEALLKSGKLRIIAGKIDNVTPGKSGLQVGCHARGADTVNFTEAALLLNCTGPQSNIGTSMHELLNAMRARGLLIAHALQMGIEMTPKGTAAGASDAIFPLGTLLMGEVFECVAVPELRQQADKVTDEVLAYLQSGRQL